MSFIVIDLKWLRRRSSETRGMRTYNRNWSVWPKMIQRQFFYNLSEVEVAAGADAPFSFSSGELFLISLMLFPQNCGK